MSAGPWQNYAPQPAQTPQAPAQSGPWANYAPQGASQATQPQSWADTAAQYAVAAGHFLKNMVPHPAAPPPLPAQNAEEWQKLSPQQKQDFGKQVSDWQAKNMVGSVNIAAGFMGAPKAASAAGAAAGKVADFAAPSSRLLEPAQQAFQNVMSKAKDVPVDVSGPGNAALKIGELSQRGHTMPKVIRDFLKRVTDPAQGDLTYQEARDFYSKAGEITSDEARKMSPSIRFWLNKFRGALGEANEDAAATVGQGGNYTSAMTDYARGKAMQAARSRVAKIGLKYVLPAGVGGALAKDYLGH